MKKVYLNLNAIIVAKNILLNLMEKNSFLILIFIAKNAIIIYAAIAILIILKILRIF